MAAVSQLKLNELFDRLDLTPNLITMSFAFSPSEVYVSGQGSLLMNVNLYRGSLSRQIKVEEDIVVMRRGSRLLCCGTVSGKVSLKDPRSLKTEHELQAHSGTISDLDVSGNTLVTCGYSQR